MRCWAYDNGTVSGRCRTTSAGRSPAPRTRSAIRARAATVGSVNRSRTLTSASSTDRMRAMSRMARSESPPRVKKESSAPTRSRPSTSANRPHSTSSVGVAGARPVVRPARSGAGRAARSSLPFLVSGIASSATNADGTMYSGSFSADVPAQLRLVHLADDIRDQPLHAGLVLAGDHRRLPTRSA
ncbi:hypothetical protein SFUMM280S_04918 [Streptomyces fumanus]